MIKIWNKAKNRPATNDEINFLVNGDDDNGQLFIAWNKVIVSEEDKGSIHLHIDSGEEETFKIIDTANEFIKDIAKLVGIDTDGIGYDGLTLSIDDFKEALAKNKKI